MLGGRGNQLRTSFLIGSVTARTLECLKLLTLLFAAVFAIFALLPTQPVSAEPDEILDGIAAYRTWTKVTKEPIKGSAIDAIAINATAGG